MIELTSRPSLIATSPSRCTVGVTSSVRPTSMYWTLLVEYEPPTVALTPEVMTGSRLPIRTLAFSLFFARIRGLASTLLWPIVFSASMLTVSGETLIVLLLWWRRSFQTRLVPPRGELAPKLTLVG